MFCFPRLRMRSGPESGNPEPISGRPSPSLTFGHFCEICTFCPKLHWWPTFALLGPKLPFSRRNALAGPKIAFCAKRGEIPSRNHWFYKHPRHGGGKVHFLLKSALWRQKCTFGPKIRFGAQKCFLEQKSTFWGSGGAKSHLRLPVCEFVRSPKGTFCSESHFSPKNNFGRQKCLLGPKWQFWPKR